MHIITIFNLNEDTKLSEMFFSIVSSKSKFHYSCFKVYNTHPSIFSNLTKIKKRTITHNIIMSKKFILLNHNLFANRPYPFRLCVSVN